MTLPIGEGGFNVSIRVGVMATVGQEGDGDKSGMQYDGLSTLLLLVPALCRGKNSGFGAWRWPASVWTPLKLTKNMVGVRPGVGGRGGRRLCGVMALICHRLSCPKSKYFGF